MDSFEHVRRIIKGRRAVFPKEFDTSIQITEDDILSVLELANWAPSHKQTEPWRFIVFREEGLTTIKEFMIQDYKDHAPGGIISEMKLKKIQEKPDLCQAIIAIIMERHEESGVPEWEELAAVACAVQNLWLAVHAKGWGGYWSTPEAIFRMQTFLQLSEQQRCIGLFYLGVPREGVTITGRRGDINQKIVWRKI
jgi:nitroreductase